MTTPKGIEELETKYGFLLDPDKPEGFIRQEFHRDLLKLISSVSSARDLEWREKIEDIVDASPKFHTDDGGTIHQVDKNGLPWDLQANGWYLVRPDRLHDLLTSINETLPPN